jgi:hypothetical protein
MSQVPKVSTCLKAAALLWAKAQEGNAPDGVSERGTEEEDDPETWEAPCARDERRPKARETGAEVEGARGVGGPNKSEEDGERPTTGPIGAKAARVDVSFRRETWPAPRRR